jgi:hypothetical protein
LGAISKSILGLRISLSSSFNEDSSSYSDSSVNSYLDDYDLHDLQTLTKHRDMGRREIYVPKRLLREKEREEIENRE